MRILFVLPALLLGTSTFADTATPAQQLAPLIASFQGDWKCAGHFANGKAISARESFDTLLGGAALRETHVDDPPFPYDADSVWNVDQQSGALLLTIHDNFGGLRVFSAKEWRSGPISFEELPVLGPLARQERFIYTRKPEGGFSYEYQMLSSGRWVMGDTLDCVKAGS
jgi:hypothetical protein